MNNSIKRVAAGLLAFAIVTGTIPSSVSREDLLGNSIIVADAEFDIDEAGISSGNAAPWIYYLGAQLYNDQVVYTEQYSSLYSVISKNSYSALWTEYPYQNTVDNTYIVVSDTTINNRVTVRGNIKLILCDGVTLTALKGICVPEGSSLDIYCQSGRSGALIADGDENNAGIGGNNGEKGGNITVNGGENAPAIGGGKGATCSSVTVYVGNVTVTGGRNGAGISADDTKIYGGHVIATGGEYAAGIGGNQNAPCKAVSIYEGTVIANLTLTRRAFTSPAAQVLASAV